MGKISGFLENGRKDAGHRPVEERIKDYRDVLQYLPGGEIERQASRCMDCGVPFCHSLGCPVSNLIPEWNDLVYRKRWKDALRLLEKTNPFPEITGRVCPALCEASCTLSINDNPVSIKQIELAIMENGFEKGWVMPLKPAREVNKRVAVIGSGPAGLASAWELRKKGYRVTVFEKSQKVGGILRFGIPDFKLEKWVLDRRVELMKKSGIVFETGVAVGEDVSVAYLKKSHDILLIAIGAGAPRDIDVPGRRLNGIHFAMDYLYQSNECVSGERSENEIISARDKNVLIIGGGDTGSDCAGTARRQGAKNIYLFEILPKPLQWNEPWNPRWPDWPVILRTSTSHEEGVNRDWSVVTKEFSGKEGSVSEAHFMRVEWKKQKPESPPGMVEVKGSGFSLDVELVLLAMGFVHAEHKKLLSGMGIEFDKRGNIGTDNNYLTNIKDVFAVGDAVTGSSLVIRAINHGKNAASSIDSFLKK